jgi:hypothetical protein
MFVRRSRWGVAGVLLDPLEDIRNILGNLTQHKMDLKASRKFLLKKQYMMGLNAQLMKAKSRLGYHTNLDKWNNFNSFIFDAFINHHKACINLVKNKTRIFKKKLFPLRLVSLWEKTLGWPSNYLLTYPKDNIINDMLIYYTYLYIRR